MWKRTITEVRQFVVKVYCECGGQFAFNGNANLSNPPQYVHACSDCGQIAYFSDQYPMDTQQEVGKPAVVPD